MHHLSARHQALGLVCLLAVLACIHAAAAVAGPIDIPVSIDQSNAIAPIVGTEGGYNLLPAQLVVVSVPFAEGAAPSGTALTAFDEFDAPLPTEQTTLAAWPDGSLRWVQLRFQSHADMSGLKEMPWEYRVRAGEPPAPSAPVTVSDADGAVTVSNGKLAVTIRRDGDGFGFARVAWAGTGAAVSGPLRFHLDFEDGTALDSTGLAASEVRVEEAGPLRAVVYLEGRFGETHAWKTRLFFHAGEAAIRAEHTLAGLGDRELDVVRRIYLTWDTPLRDGFAFRAGGGVVDYDGALEPGETLVLDQVAPAFLPPRDFSYRLAVEGGDAPREVGRGGRAGGWVRAQDETWSVGVAVRNFSAMAPKAVRLGHDGRFTVDLWTEREVLTLSRARAITHEVRYSFAPTPAAPNTEQHSRLLVHKVTQDLPHRAFTRPLVPVPDVAYMCATRAFGPYVSSASSRLPDFERVVAQNFENFQARQQDRASSFGMLHYGDHIAPLGSDNGGNPDRPHWRDHEWEYASALFLGFLRRGDTRAFQLGVVGYRHFMDVDVHQTRRFNFYHGYGDHGNMHEQYVGPEDGHTVLAGLVDAYLFTGDRRALEVAEGLGDTHIALFTNDRFLPEVYGIKKKEGEDSVERMLREQVRAVAWSSLAILRLYDITRDAKYINALDKVLNVMAAKPEFWMRGGIWQSALQSAFLETHHRLTGDPRSRDLFLEHVDWILDNYYLPEFPSMGQREGKAEYGYGPNSLAAGGSLMVIAAQFGYAYTLTHDRYYLETAWLLMQEGLRSAGEGRPREPMRGRTNHSGATRTDGKWVGQINYYTNNLPIAFEELSDGEMASIRNAVPRRPEELSR